MRRLAFAVFLFVLPASACLSEASPEAATSAYFAALKADGMSAAPKFMHPEELEKFKVMLLPVLEAEAQAGQSQFREVIFGPASTLETARDAQPEEFMTRLLSVLTAQAEGLGGIQFDSVKVLGSIAERKDLVHVLTRTSVGVGELAVSAMEVVSWRPYRGEWRTILSGEMEGLARQLQASIRR